MFETVRVAKGAIFKQKYDIRKLKPGMLISDGVVAVWDVPYTIIWDV